MKSLGTTRRSHRIDFHDDETQLGQGLLVGTGGPKGASAHAAGLWSVIEVI